MKTASVVIDCMFVFTIVPLASSLLVMTVEFFRHSYWLFKQIVQAKKSGRKIILGFPS